MFSVDEALALLDGRTGLSDEAAATAVAAELGHLPLALDQAATVIAGQQLGYAAYLARLQRSRSRMTCSSRTERSSGTHQASRRRCCKPWRPSGLPIRWACAARSWN